MITKEELKPYFMTGKMPTQEEFWKWMDSYWHKDEKISADAVDGMEKVIPLIINDELKGSFLSVKIPKEVKKIGSNAYNYNGFLPQIREVALNEGLEEIGKSAFGAQCIKKIRMPSSLKIIRNGAFSGQLNANDNTDSLDEIILNEGLEIIEDYAFSSPDSSKVKDIYIPDSVRFVGVYAFYISSLETVSAPSGLDLSNSGLPATAIITYR